MREDGHLSMACHLIINSRNHFCATASHRSLAPKQSNCPGILGIAAVLRQNYTHGEVEAA
ncbi:MAG: hypothetical protein MET45_26615 [Nostoc sp. LLA-1]|nr:hypothetical protein [Cyanocohniella sp. LLY]